MGLYTRYLVDFHLSPLGVLVDLHQDSHFTGEAQRGQAACLGSQRWGVAEWGQGPRRAFLKLSISPATFYCLPPAFPNWEFRLQNPCAPPWGPSSLSEGVSCPGVDGEAQAGSPSVLPMELRAFFVIITIHLP